MIIDMGDHPMADSLMTLLDLTATKDSPAVRSLKEKAESINVPFVEVLQVYADALLEYKRSGSKLTGEQYAFNAVNVYVADRKAPTINEKFENLNESLFGSMFIPPTTRFMAALSSSPRYPSLSGGGDHKDHYSRKDSKDEAARGAATHSYAAAAHARNITAAGRLPSRNKYKPNASSSSSARYEAQAVDSEHAKARAKFPKEYAVSPHHAFNAHFSSAGSLPHLKSKVVEYDKHYRAAKGLGKSADYDLQEKFTSKPHGEDNKVTKGGHHLSRVVDGKKRHVADLKLEAESPNGPGGHLYSCYAPGAEKPFKNSRGKPVMKTLAAWKADENGNLESHCDRHDKLAAMKSEEFEVDTMVAHAATVVKTLGGPKGAADFMKRRAREKAKTLKDKLNNRHLHKEE
jgi:hypothetical protein